jgi:hypothetical protein
MHGFFSVDVRALTLQTLSKFTVFAAISDAGCRPAVAALTGRSTSPGIFDALAVLGREESLGRIADQAASY